MGTTYAAGSSQTLSAGNTTLYARWISEYAISYTLNDGSNHGSNPSLYTSEDANISLSDATAPVGFHFEGWYTEAAFTNKVTGVAIPTGSSGAKTFYARHTYTVTYEGNSNTGGTKPVDSAVTTKGSAVTLATNSGSLVKTGYRFAGWNTKADGSGTTYAVGTSQTFTAGDTELYARWVSEHTAAAGEFFEYQVRVADASVPVVVPTNGRSTGAVSFGQAYSWYVEVSDDRVDWSLIWTGFCS
jgi:uncharacterized repeat protein (TIGR02543 family)